MLRKTLPFLILILFCSVPAAWGFPTFDDSSQSGSQQSQPTVTTAAPLRIVTFGDSITRGFGATPYSTYLNQLHKAAGCNVKIFNEGKDSETTIDGRSRINSVLAQYQPDYILIMEGANDARSGIGESASYQYQLTIKQIPTCEGSADHRSLQYRRIQENYSF